MYTSFTYNGIQIQKNCYTIDVVIVVCLLIQYKIQLFRYLLPRTCCNIALWQSRKERVTRKNCCSNYTCECKYICMNILAYTSMRMSCLVICLHVHMYICRYVCRWLAFFHYSNSFIPFSFLTSIPFNSISMNFLCPYVYLYIYVGAHSIAVPYSHTCNAFLSTLGGASINSAPLIASHCRSSTTN